jgi:hypothetical protein
MKNSNEKETKFFYAGLNKKVIKKIENKSEIKEKKIKLAVTTTQKSFASHGLLTTSNVKWQLIKKIN